MNNKARLIVSFLTLAISISGSAMPIPSNRACPAIHSAQIDATEWKNGMWLAHFHLPNELLNHGIVETAAQNAKDAEILAQNALFAANTTGNAQLQARPYMNMYYSCSSEAGNYTLSPGINSIYVSSPLCLVECNSSPLPK